MKKRRQLKKYYPPLKSTCRLQTCPNTQATCDGQQFSHQLERVEESVDKIRGRHRRKQAGTTGKSPNMLSVVGEDATKAFDGFELGETQDDSKTDVLAKFDENCEPRTQVIYEHYRCNNRNQEPGENIASYLTELRTIAKNCQHESITPDEILRDRRVLGIRDEKMRERLLR